jgi:hypothetical protein
MPFCIKFKYFGTFFVPELSDTADITLRISQARNLLLSYKQIPVYFRCRLYQAIVVNVALWGSESCALKEETGNVEPQLSHQEDMQVDDVRYIRETDHERT